MQIGQYNSTEGKSKISDQQMTHQAASLNLSIFTQVSSKSKRKKSPFIILSTHLCEQCLI